MAKLETTHWLNIALGRPFECGLTWEDTVADTAKNLPRGTIVAVTRIGNGRVYIAPISTLTSSTSPIGIFAVLSSPGIVGAKALSLHANATSGYLDREAVYETTEYDTTATYSAGTLLTVADGKLKPASSGDLAVAKAMAAPYQAGVRSYLPFRFIEPVTVA